MKKKLLNNWLILLALYCNRFKVETAYINEHITGKAIVVFEFSVGKYYYPINNIYKYPQAKKFFKNYLRGCLFHGGNTFKSNKKDKLIELTKNNIEVLNILKSKTD